MQDTSQPLVSGLLPIAVLVMCEIAISVGMVKSALFRKWICGRPILVIRNGKVDQKELRRLRMTIEDLSAQLRQQGIAHMDDVSYAIVETNGSLSVLKKPAQDVPTAQMLQLDPPDEGLELVVISDGKIFDVSLSLCGHTREWLDGILGGAKSLGKRHFHHDRQYQWRLPDYQKGGTMRRIWAVWILLLILGGICTLGLWGTFRMTRQSRLPWSK